MRPAVYVETTVLSYLAARPSRDLVVVAHQRLTAEWWQAAPAGLPQVTVALRQVDLRHWGLDAVEVLESVRTAYQGDTVGQTYRGNAVFNVIVLLVLFFNTRSFFFFVIMPIRPTLLLCLSLW